MVSSALASRTLTPSGRLWRPKCSCGRILSNHAVLTQTYPSKTKKPRYREALLVLVGPGGFEPPTSTMSRPIGRTKTRVDAVKLSIRYCSYKAPETFALADCHDANGDL